jgi:hypothetical protein
MIMKIQVFWDITPCQLVKSDNIIENFNVEQQSCEDHQILHYTKTCGQAVCLWQYSAGAVFLQLYAVVSKFSFRLGRAVWLKVLHFYGRWQCVLRKCEVNEKISLGCRCSYNGASNYMDVTRNVLQVPVALWPQYCQEWWIREYWYIRRASKYTSTFGHNFIYKSYVIVL